MLSWADSIATNRLRRPAFDFADNSLGCEYARAQCDGAAREPGCADAVESSPESHFGGQKVGVD